MLRNHLFKGDDYGSLPVADDYVHLSTIMYGFAKIVKVSTACFQVWNWTTDPDHSPNQYVWAGDLKLYWRMVEYSIKRLELLLARTYATNSDTMCKKDILNHVHIKYIRSCPTAIFLIFLVNSEGLRLLIKETRKRNVWLC